MSRRWVATIETQLAASGWPPAQREYRFHPKRRWRFDFAWPDQKVALEYEGGTWTGGAHVRGRHYASDCEKYNAATLLGWRVFRVTRDMADRGYVLELFEQVYWEFDKLIDDAKGET